MSTLIYKGGGGVKNGQNLVYVVKVCPLLENQKPGLLELAVNMCSYFSPNLADFLPIYHHLRTKKLVFQFSNINGA